MEGQTARLCVSFGTGQMCELAKMNYLLGSQGFLSFFF